MFDAQFNAGDIKPTVPRRLFVGLLTELPVHGRSDYLALDDTLRSICGEVVADRLPNMKWDPRQSCLSKKAQYELAARFGRFKVIPTDRSARILDEALGVVTQEIDRWGNSVEAIPVERLKDYAQLVIINEIKPIVRKLLITRSSRFKFNLLSEISIAKDALESERRRMELFASLCWNRALDGEDIELDGCASEPHLIERFVGIRRMRPQNVSAEIRHSVMKAKCVIQELATDDSFPKIRSSEFVKKFIWRVFVDDLLHGLEKFYLSGELRRQPSQN